jgi:glycosyltransferase involved in cell wall biosynthesis
MKKFDVVPLISTIIPYFNGMQTVERAIMSALSASHNVEVIVVNDGSDAENTAFIRQLQATVRFKLIETENQGQSAARNSGVADSSGDLLCFLDQDDFFLANHYDVLLGLLERNDSAAFVYGDLWRVSPEGFVLKRSCIFDNAQHPKKSLEQMLSEDMHILPSASLIRREAFEDVGGFDPQFMGYEDDDFFLRLYLAGKNSAFTEIPITAWTLDWNSTSFSPLYKRSRVRFARKYLHLLPAELGPSVYTLEVLYERFWKLLVLDQLRLKVSRNKNQGEEVQQFFSQFYLSLRKWPRFSWPRKLVLGAQFFLSVRSPASAIRSGLAIAKWVPFFGQLRLLSNAIQAEEIRHQYKGMIKSISGPGD